MTTEMKVALAFTAFAVVLSMTIFRSTWAPIFRAIYEGLREIVQEIRSIDREWLYRKLGARKQRKRERGPLTLANMKERCAMPMLFVVMIPIMLFFMRLSNIQIGNDMNSAAIMIAVIMIVALVVIVVWAMGQTEKNLRRKFWMELSVALFMEALLVLHLHLFLGGYYYEHAHGAKRMMTAVYCFPFYIIYMEKSNRNWQALQDLKKAETKIEMDGQ